MRGPRGQRSTVPCALAPNCSARLVCGPHDLAMVALWLRRNRRKRGRFSSGTEILEVPPREDLPVKEILNLRAAGFFEDPWNRRNYWSVNGYWWGVWGRHDRIR